ncbi:MAG: DUF4271 domain-containing protein [Flavobacteriaceae bacterium]|tara:strand:- start:930 stop:1586 length:657 start_codon:yes stop_codon:yes gene_type:complete
MLREVISNDGYVLCGLLSLTLLLIVKILHSKRLFDFLGFLGNSNYLRIYLKDHSFLDGFDTLLALNFCLNGTIFGYITHEALLGDIAMNSSVFFISFGLIALGLLLKIGIELLIGYAFDLYNLLNVLTFQQISTINFVGILLLPINALLVFHSNFQKSAVLIVVILIILVFIFGMVKTIQSYQKLILSNFLYFILYICTLEFGPCIIIYNYLRHSNHF